MIASDPRLHPTRLAAAGIKHPYGVTLRDVVEHLAFETPHEAADIMLRPRSKYLQELRLAAIWVAREVTNLSANALARAFGKSHVTMGDLIARAEFHREWDPEFRRLTDTVVGCLTAPALERFGADAPPALVAEIVA